MRILSCLIPIFLFIACSTPVKTFVQTSNEGIFIQSQRNKSVNIKIQNASNLPSNLKIKLETALNEQGFKISQEQADFEILLNAVDFRKVHYAKRIDGRSFEFFYGPFMRLNYDVETENYYIMQVNVQISQKNQSQKTSLIARTNYLSDSKEAFDALEDKIVKQIISFFYLDN